VTLSDYPYYPYPYNYLDPYPYRYPSSPLALALETSRSCRLCALYAEKGCGPCRLYLSFSLPGEDWHSQRKYSSLRFSLKLAVAISKHYRFGADAVLSLQKRCSCA
jgi:hypothetical protein